MLFLPAQRSAYFSSITHFSSAMWAASWTGEWPFAPLSLCSADQDRTSQRKRLKGVVFDMDGTLCLPQTYMFGEMRDALGIPKSVDILEHIESLESNAQVEAQQSIRAIERRAMASQTPQPGLLRLMTYLDSKQVKKAICTRNFDEPVNHLLTKFLPNQHFHPVITRSFKPPKPDPSGIIHIAESWGEAKSDRAGHMIMVGDSIDDMVAGSRAGAVTILLSQGEANSSAENHESTHFCATSLEDIVGVLEKGSLKQD